MLSDKVGDLQTLLQASLCELHLQVPPRSMGISDEDCKRLTECKKVDQVLRTVLPTKKFGKDGSKSSNTIKTQTDVGSWRTQDQGQYAKCMV